MKRLVLAGLIALSAMSATTASAKNWKLPGFIACSIFTLGICSLGAIMNDDKLNGKDLVE